MLDRLCRELEGVGFSSKEAGVYLALLEFGALRAHQISRHSGINRSTVYLALEALMERGIVSCTDDEGTKCFVAESPVHLERIVEDERRRHTQASLRIQESMPHFFALWNAIEHKPTVRFFEGQEGMEQCRELMLQLASGIETGSAFIHYDEQTIHVARQREKQRLRFHSGRLRMRVLYSIDEGFELPEFGKNAVLRQLPSSIASFRGEVEIFSSFVLLASAHRQITAVIIENTSIAELFQSFFELAWSGAEK